MRMKTHITMKKTFKILGIVLVVALFVGTFVFLYQKSRPKAQHFEVIEVKRADIRRSTIVTGTIEPRVEVDVKPQISGIVGRNLKEAGQTVQKGELIARIKVVPDMAQLNSAENRVKLAQLSSQQALRDFERTKTLYDQKLVSAEEFEKSATGPPTTARRTGQRQRCTQDCEGRREQLHGRQLHHPRTLNH